MPVLLDTDHLSLLEWEEQPACQQLLERLDRLPADDIATSIVSFHEQVQGWLAYLNRARKAKQVIDAYGKRSDHTRGSLYLHPFKYGFDRGAS